jgi:hypothetical protein
MTRRVIHAHPRIRNRRVILLRVGSIGFDPGGGPPHHGVFTVTEE